jgi:hypothetical protein
MRVLVDSSAWIAYFRGASGASAVDGLIEEGLLVTNDLILAELVPPLLFRRENKLAGLLREIDRMPLIPDWSGIVEMQVTCLRNGINRVGIPDLMIAQNAIHSHAALLSLDKHFMLMSRHIPLEILS